MGDFSDFKITDNDIAQKGVVAAPDKLTGTAAQNKAIFDRLVREVVKTRYNEMLTALETDISEYLGESEEERRAAETQRDHNENGYTDEEEVFHNGRVQNETARQTAETARQAAEAARNVWEPYDNTKAYVVNNKVLYGGSSYVCTAACTGVAPPNAAHWQLIAQKGADGSIDATTLTTLSGVLFGNGSTVEAKALDAPGGAASAASMNKAFADLAPVEAGDTASQAYAAGDYLELSGTLYRVTAAIANGETITPGTNVTAVTVCGELTARLPSGLIAMWSGAADAIPDGWLLCNGSNGTPDLRDRFVVGAGSTYAVGATGGEATHKLTIQEMPIHTHNIPARQDAAHSGAISWNGATTQTLKNTLTDATGGGQAHNNLPPYYALCYIMKA